MQHAAGTQREARGNTLRDMQRKGQSQKTQTTFVDAALASMSMGVRDAALIITLV